MSILRPYLLLAAAICFGLGASLPLVRFEKLWLFSETPSLLGLVHGLWQEGSLLLSAIVGLFSIVAILPPDAHDEGHGLLFQKDNPLVPWVDAALSRLIEQGTVQELVNTWLVADPSLPVITE